MSETKPDVFDIEITPAIWRYIKAIEHAVVENG